MAREIADAAVRVRPEFDDSNLVSGAAKMGADAGDAAGDGFAANFGAKASGAFSMFAKSNAVATTAVAGLGVASTAAFGLVGAGAAMAGIAIAKMGFRAILAGEEMQKKWEQFTQGIQKQMADIAKPLQPVLSNFMTTVQSTLTRLTPFLQQAFSALAPALNQSISIIGNTVASLGPVFAQVARASAPFITALASGLSAALKAILPAVAQLFENMAPMAPLFGQLVGSIGTLLLPLVDLIGVMAQLGGPLIETVVRLLAGLLSGVANALTTALRALAPTFGPIIDSIGALVSNGLDILVQLLPPVINLFVQINQAIQPLLPILLQLAVDVLSVLVAQFRPLVPMIGDFAKAIAQNAVQAIQDLMPGIMALLDAIVELLPAMLPLIGAMLELATALLPLVPLFAQLVSILVTNLLPILVPIIRTFADWATTLINLLVPAIETVVGWLTQNLGPAFQRTLTTVGDVAMWLWNNALRPFFNWVTGTLFPGMVSAGETWWRAVQTVFNAVKAIIDNVVLPAFRLAQTGVTTVMNAIRTVIETTWAATRVVFNVWIAFMDITWGNAFRVARALIETVFTAIRNTIQTVSNFIQNNILQPAASWIQNTFGPYWVRLREVITAAWNGLRDAIQAAWNYMKSNVFDPISNLITQTLPNAFQSGVNAIGRWWDELREKAAAPVRFVVNTVVQKGIIDTVNRVTGALGHSANIPSVAFMHGGRVGGRNGGATRGDNTQINAQIGEYLMPVDMTRRYFGLLETMRLGKLPPMMPGTEGRPPHGHGFQDGGLIGKLGGFLGDVLSFFTDPLETIIKAAGIDRIVGQFGNSPYVRGLVGVPEKIMESVAQWFKTNADKLMGGDAGAGTWKAQPFGWPGPYGNQPPWAANTAAAAAHIRARFPGQATNSYVSPFGWSDHFPKAIDLPANAFTAAGLARGNGIVQEAVRTSALYGLKYIIWNARFTSGLGWGPYSGTDNPHTDHVHLSYYGDGGRINAMRNGGTIPEPVYGIGKSGRRYAFGEAGEETVIPNKGFNVSYTFNVDGDVSERTAEEIKSHVNEQLKGLLVQLQTGRRK
jgi:phage-related protein